MNLDNLNQQQRFRQELLASLDFQQQQYNQNGDPQFNNKQKNANEYVEEEKTYNDYQIDNRFDMMKIEDSNNFNNYNDYQQQQYELNDHENDDLNDEDNTNGAMMTNIVISPSRRYQNKQLIKYTSSTDNQSVSPVRPQQIEQQKPYSESNLENISEIAKEIKTKKAYIWSFGKNSDGELGISSQKDQFLPKPISIQNLKLSHTAKYISSGSHHSAIVTKAGELYVSGSQLHGKLGIQSVNGMHVSKFTQVTMFDGIKVNQKVKQVACGDYHTLCLMQDGQVFAWGGTLHKKVGEKNAQAQNNEPRIVSGLQGKQIVHIDCGDFHSVALDIQGRVYSWGGGGASYNKGQCGHGNNEDIEQPIQVQGIAHRKIVQISAGGFHTLALCEEDNELYAWGSGTYGECGLGEFQASSKPKIVKMPKDFVSNQEMNQMQNEFAFSSQKPLITQISAGGHHTLLLTSRGRVYSFGYGSHGQLGLRSTKNFCSPQLVKDLLSKNIKAIAAGWNHSLILSDKGDLFACGYGNHGQLGLNDKEPRTQFTHVANLGGKNAYNIYAGGNHSWVVIDDLMPVRDNYRPPSPVGGNDSVSPLQQSPRASNNEQKQNLNMFQQQPKQGAQHILKKRKFDIGLHVTYTDTSMCHRFITFEFPKQNGSEDQKAKESLDEFIRSMYRDESGALLYHKIQEGYDEVKSTPFQDHTNISDEKFFTVCLIFDPEKSQQLKPFIQKLHKQNINQQTQKHSIDQPSKMIFYEDQDLIGNQFEYNMANWVYEFATKVGDKFCVRKPRFSELRPANLKSF